MSNYNSNWGRWEVCILAGGLSSRMGRDKSRLRLGGRTLLSRIRATARRLNLPVRVIRRDRVPRCGPIGGIFTALVTSRTSAVLFLSCDMPFVSEELLRELQSEFRPKMKGLFVAQGKSAGFPFLLRTAVLPKVEELLQRKRYSLQHLVRALRADLLRPGRAYSSELLNVNTPSEWDRAKQQWEHRDLRQYNT